MTSTSSSSVQRGDGSPYDVVIVGCGPVGATLAGLLGRGGHQVLVIDKADDIFPLPRALGLDDTAMRLFQSLGVADALQAHVAPFPASVYRGTEGQPIQIFDMAPPPHTQAWAPNYSFDQPALERVLRHTIAALPSVEMRLGAEWIEQTQLDDQVEIRYTQHGTARTARCRYLVACDGARSPVRESIGLRIEDLQFDEPWIVIDFDIDSSAEEHLPRTNVQYCDPRRPATYVVGPGSHRRWEIMVLPEDKPFETMKQEDLWQLLSPWVTVRDGTIRRAASYRFHALVGETWRDRRVLLAGDAAHQMPPFLGQGMCQGLRDASNLWWKLQAVLNGADDRLLDTYALERRTHVREITGLVKSLGKIICERDPERARQRDQDMLAAQGGAPRVKIRQDLFPPIRQGLVCADTPGAGAVFPQGRLCAGSDDEARSDDAMGHWFKGFFLREALLPTYLDALEKHAPPGLRMCALGNADAGAADSRASVDASGLMRLWMQEREVSMVIVRPDHHVYWSGSNVNDMTIALNRLRIQLQQPRPALI